MRDDLYFNLAFRYFWFYFKSLNGRGFQKKIGEMIGTNPSYISEIARGKKRGSEKLCQKIVNAVKKLLPNLEVIQQFGYDDFYDFGKFLSINSPLQENWQFSETIPRDIKNWRKNRNVNQNYRKNNPDIELLAKIISSIQGVINGNNLDISTDKKAQIISLMYDEVAGIRENILTENIDHLIKNSQKLKLLLELAS